MLLNTNSFLNDCRVSELLDYTAEELTGRNLYTLCHGEDAHRLRKSHIDLINKGQVLTHYYRLMNKCGGYTWLQTCATVVCNTKNAEEQNVICVNYVLSAREYGHVVMDCCQIEGATAPVKRETGQDPENGSPDGDPGGKFLNFFFLRGRVIGVVFRSQQRWTGQFYAGLALLAEAFGWAIPGQSH